MLLTDYKPVSKLVLPKTLIDCPKFPVIDAHDHLGEWFGDWSKRPIQQLLDLLDEANVKVYVDLDGGWGEDILNAHLDAFKNAAPDRFQVFGGVNWEEWGQRGDKFGEWAAERFRLQVARGAQGLKIWKNVGVHVKDQHGNLVAVDDSCLDPLWVTVSELSSSSATPSWSSSSAAAPWR